MTNEPVRTIGTVMTSAKVAAVAIATLVAAMLDMTGEDAALFVAAVSAVAILLGDVVQLIWTRDHVTPVAAPKLHEGAVVTMEDGERGYVRRVGV